MERGNDDNCRQKKRPPSVTNSFTIQDATCIQKCPGVVLMRMNYLLLLFVGLFWLPAHASPLAVGDALPPIAAKDLSGKDFTLTTNVQYLLVATEMACAKAANHKLAELGSGFLEKQHAAYLMDIHTMPAVARWFAFPKMRKYPQRIVLVDSAETLAAIPVQPDCVTVLNFTAAGRIRKISYWDPAGKPVAEFLQ